MPGVKLKTGQECLYRKRSGGEVRERTGSSLQRCKTVFWGGQMIYLSEVRSDEASKPDMRKRGGGRERAGHLSAGHELVKVMKH